MADVFNSYNCEERGRAATDASLPANVPSIDAASSMGGADWRGVVMDAKDEDWYVVTGAELNVEIKQAAPGGLYILESPRNSAGACRLAAR